MSAMSDIFLEAEGFRDAESALAASGPNAASAMASHFDAGPYRTGWELALRESKERSGRA